MIKRVYFFTGLPCSGKTYAAKLIARHAFPAHGAEHISTGDIARKLSTTQDLRDKTAAADLFPIEDALRAELKRAVEDSKQPNVVVDGFPRFGDQAKYILDEFWVYNPLVIEINAGDAVTLINRARMRARDDEDSPARFMARLVKAEKNLSEVHAVLTSRLCPLSTLFSGSDESMIKAFTRINEGINGNK